MTLKVRYHNTPAAAFHFPFHSSTNFFWMQVAAVAWQHEVNNPDDNLVYCPSPRNSTYATSPTAALASDQVGSMANAARMAPKRTSSCIPTKASVNQTSKVPPPPSPCALHCSPASCPGASSGCTHRIFCKPAILRGCSETERPKKIMERLITR